MPVSCRARIRPFFTFWPTATSMATTAPETRAATMPIRVATTRPITGSVCVSGLLRTGSMPTNIGGRPPFCPPARRPLPWPDRAPARRRISCWLFLPGPTPAAPPGSGASAAGTGPLPVPVLGFGAGAASRVDRRPALLSGLGFRLGFGAGGHDLCRCRRHTEQRRSPYEQRTRHARFARSWCRSHGCVPFSARGALVDGHKALATPLSVMIWSGKTINPQESSCGRQSRARHA